MTDEGVLKQFDHMIRGFTNRFAPIGALYSLEWDDLYCAGQLGAIISNRAYNPSKRVMLGTWVYFGIKVETIRCIGEGRRSHGLSMKGQGYTKEVNWEDSVDRSALCARTADSISLLIDRVAVSHDLRSLSREHEQVAMLKADERSYKDIQELTGVPIKRVKELLREVRSLVVCPA